MTRQISYLVHIDWYFGERYDEERGYGWSAWSLRCPDMIIVSEVPGPSIIIYRYDTMPSEPHIVIWEGPRMAAIIYDGYRYLSGPSTTLYVEISRLMTKL